MDDTRLFERLHADLQAMQETAVSEALDRSAAVPSCPGWTVADLFGHVWANHRWVRTILRTRDRAEVPAPGPDPVADFVDSVADQLIAVRSIDPNEPCWNFGPPPRLAGFWTRRQAHEHAIHRVDLALALGLPAVEIDAEFAADGVDEVVEMFYPRQVRVGRSPAVEAAITLRATDAAGEWTLGEGESAAVVSAPARALYLGIWKRASLLDDAAVRIDGDEAAVKAALTLPLTP